MADIERNAPFLLCTGVVLGAAASILQFREDKLKKKVKITYRERMVDGGAERCKGPGSRGRAIKFAPGAFLPPGFL